MGVLVGIEMLVGVAIGVGVGEALGTDVAVITMNTGVAVSMMGEGSCSFGGDAQPTRIKIGMKIHVSANAYKPSLFIPPPFTTDSTNALK